MSRVAPLVEPTHADAVLAACILAVDPAAIGGICLRSRAGPEREQFVAMLRALLPHDRPIRRLPLNIGDDRLLGGLDLAATLQARRPVVERGLLADVSGGLLIAPTAERLSQPLAARLAAVLDSGSVTVERDGFGTTSAANIAILALDEGITDDEVPPHVLLDRLAIHVDFTMARPSSVDSPFSIAQIEAARETLPAVHAGDEIACAICGVAVELGVASIRAQIAAIKVARIHAALDGRKEINNSDTIVAARLVLLPRATQLPAVEEQSKETEQPEPQQADAPEQSDEDSSDQNTDEPEEGGQLADIVLEAVAAAIPAGLLDRVRANAAKRLQSATSGRAGASCNATSRGRPVGTHRRAPRAGARLHLVETLRAAVPWQALRRAESGATDGRVMILREDFRTIRFRHRSETATIFVVDASGSAAMHRLAEAKGAVELLLADCYIRRDQVAMISFRGVAAELLLPPTRSLARAKRTLASLPGGGGTPLANAIDAGHALADALRRKGIFPTLVFLTDGRANVGREPTGNRVQAQDEAYAAARICRAGHYSTLVVDTSPRPGPSAEKLASEIGGVYLPLPYADAGTISRAIRQVTPGDHAVTAH